MTANGREAALSALDKLASWRADDRDDWLKVGMALHSASPDLLKDWNRWSMQSEKYRPGECRRKWKGFISGKGVGLGTLIHMAKTDSGDDSVGQGNGSQTRNSSRPASKPKPAAATETATPPPWKRPIEDTYDYHDVQGKVLYREVKFGDGLEPRFMYQHPVASGEWEWGRNGIPVVPFNLPGLLTADPAERVYLCEGAKDATRLQSLGLVATTNCGGAKNWGNEHSKYLKDRRTAILEDNDDAGRVRSIMVPASLWGVASEIKVIAIPGLEIKGDISDWIDDGGTLDQLLELVEQTPEWTPSPGSDPGNNPTPPPKAEVRVDSTSSKRREADAPKYVAYQPFPVDVLPEPLRSTVNVGAATIGCDPAFVALPLLSACAAAIGNVRWVRLKGGWTEPPILWTVLVGESGCLKTPAFKLATSALRARQAQALRRHAQDMIEYELNIARHDKAFTAWKRGKSTSDEDPPVKPEQPEAERCVVSDATVEAMATILMANPRGVLLARDELAGWIGSFDRYAGGKGGGDSAHWLSMHNGESMVVDRKTGQRRTLYVPAASVSITGGVQPGILRRVLGAEHRESGLLARLLLCMPPRRTKRWTEAEILPQDEATIALLFERLFSLEPDQDSDGGPRPRIVGLTPGAKLAWIRFFNEHAKEHAELSGDLSAAWSKLEGYAARLALVLHCVRWAAGDQTLQREDQVDEAGIAAGVTLSRWFCNEVRRVYAVLGESEEVRECRQLIELVQRKGGEITVREMMRSSRMFGSSSDAEAAFEGLVESGDGVWVNQQPGPQGGQPSRCFNLVVSTVDSVDVDDTPSDDHATGGTVNVNSVNVPTDGNGDGWGEV